MGKHSNGPIGNSPDPHANEQALDNVTNEQVTQQANEVGVDPHDHLTTHQEWQNRFQEATGDGTGPVSIQRLQHLMMQRMEADEREPSVKQLADQQDNLMAPPSVPNVNHMRIPHETLWESVHNDADPETLHGVGDMWTKRANHLTTAQDKVLRGMAASESGWSGDDAERARNASTLLAKHAGQIQSGAHLAGKSLQQQASALDTARNSMEKPPAMQDPPEPKYDPVDERRALQKVQDNPAEHDKVQKYYTNLHHNQKVRHQQAARTAQTYDHTTTHLSSTQPAFAPPPKVTSGGGDSDGGGSTGGFGGGHSGNSAPPHTGGTQNGNNQYRNLLNDTGGTGNGWNGAPQLQGDELTDGGTTGTDPSGGGFGDITQRPYVPGGGNGGGSGWGDTSGGGRGHGGMMIPPGGSLGGSTGSGGGSGSGGSGGRLGGRGGLSGTGEGGSGTGDKAPGSGGRTGGRTAAGGRAAAGAAEGESAAGRPGPGSERTGGRGGRPMMGGRGRGGQGEDDHEHETPDFLEGPDDEFWSPQQKVAPPVIGDWLGEYDPTKPGSYNPNRDR